MRALMLGWDFSPRLSGGVGSACQGLANALARGATGARTEVLFVLPRMHGDEEAQHVRLFSGRDLERAVARNGAGARAQAAPRLGFTAPSGATSALRAGPVVSGATGATEASGARDASGTRGDAPERGTAADAPPTLPTPAEALRLLTLDSPLQPYLTPAEYGALVHARVTRIRASGRSPARAPAASAAAPSSTGAVASPAVARPAAVARAAAVAPPPERHEAAVSDASVPTWGRDLFAEVERYARAVLALVQREDFDVIHAHDWMTFPAALLVKERTGKPLVVHFHSSEPERRGRGSEPAADVRAIEQAALDAADRVVCVSEASARVLRAHYAVELAKLRVVHDAFAPLALAPALPAAESTRAGARGANRPRARSEARTVLFLGRLSEQKAPDVFLRAAALVAGAERAARKRVAARTRFVMAGDGALYPELKRLARELGLARRVRFTGFVSGAELARTYAGADVYVLSSAAEPFGIGALEALSLGVPTIVPRGAGVSEVVRSVLVFEPLDAEDLADKILAVLAHPALRRQLAADGLREVKEIRWDRPARALRGIYDELALSHG